MKNLIINADDFNISSSRNRGIIDLVNKGIVSSVSVIVNTSRLISIEDLSIFLLNNVSIGLHINITEGETTQSNIISNTLFKERKFHGKFEFYNKIENNHIIIDEIKEEIISQIQLFNKQYGIFPTHIDGHQHIHIITEIAYEISKLLSDFCIYKTRIPIEYAYPESELKLTDFHKKIIKFSMESKQIYSKYGIVSTNYFIGMSFMGDKFNSDEIIDILEANNSKEDMFFELMCHPGTQVNNKDDSWDDFDKSEDRYHEYKELIALKEKFSNKKKIEIKSFIDLPTIPINNHDKANIIIVGELTYATGNNITAQRIKSILNDKFNISLFSISSFNVLYNNYLSMTEDSQLKNITLNKMNWICNQFNCLINSSNIKLILGINLYRAGLFLNYFHSFPKYSKTPYSLLMAGTDINHFIDKPSTKKVIDEIVRNSYGLIGLNPEMNMKIQDYYPNLICENKTINQSIDIQNLKNSIEQFKKQFDRNSLLQKYLKIEVTKDVIISLIPSGIRKVKDPLYLLQSFKKIIENNKNHYFILIGAILDHKFYEEVKLEIEPIKSNFKIIEQIPQNEFLFLLSQADLIINSSVSEGVSNCIIESMALGKIVIARKNTGNCYLINHCKTGFIFNDNDEFLQLFNSIFDQNRFNLEEITKNAIEFISETHSIENERKSYADLFNNIIGKAYFNYYFQDQIIPLKILSPSVHPFSYENNFLFEKIQFSSKKKVRILDIGCGFGPMSIIYLLNNTNLHIEEIVFSDIDDWSLYSVKYNIEKLLEILNGRLIIEKVSYIKSDLLSNIESDSKFNLILVNLPQSPCYEAFRNDKYGGELGSELYEKLFIDIKRLFYDDTRLYFLHISLCNPRKISEILLSNDLMESIVYTQIRKITVNEVNQLKLNLFNYWLDLKNRKIMEFKHNEDENTIEYEVMIKQVQLKISK